MRKLSVSDREVTESRFKTSIYTNCHLGWFDCWKIAETSGDLWLDEIKEQKYFIALQHIMPDIHWLHTFFSTSAPSSYPLFTILKRLLPPGNHSVYSISSHKWYSSFLEPDLDSYRYLGILFGSAVSIGDLACGIQCFQSCGGQNGAVWLAWHRGTERNKKSPFCSCIYLCGSGSLLYSAITKIVSSVWQKKR